MLKTIRTLLGYVLCAILFIVPLILLTLPALFRNRWALVSLYSIDLTICAICHGELLESISARSYRFKHLKRYNYQRKLIDGLAVLFGGEPEHCRRAIRWETKVINLKR